MKIEKRLFGATKSGELVQSFTLTNQNGLVAEILTYGGVLRSLQVPAAEGLRDVVLGFDTVADYENQDKYMGVLVGRVANRIGGARCTIAGRDYQLTANSWPNCLHGGENGFDKKLWQAGEEEDGLVLSYTSPDGEEGFPGNLQAQARYTLTSDDALVVEFMAETDADTLVNLTSHSYFNLARQPETGIGGHQLQIFSGAITEIDETGAANGCLLAVAGTPFDFSAPRLLAEALAGIGKADQHPQLRRGAGIDHNYVLKNDWDSLLRLAAVLQADGLRLECLSTQPGLHLYTGNYLAGELGKGGAVYGPRSGLCLETQNWPNAVHHSHFPSCLLKRGQRYQQTTVYRFSSC